MKELKALIFDVDGTLADTERYGHRVAFNKAFVEMGLGWHWSVEVYGDLLTVSGGKERIRFFMEKYHPTFPPEEDRVPFIADLHRRKTRIFIELLASGVVPLRLGVYRLLTEARAAGIRLAIATTTASENVAALLQYGAQESIRDWFVAIAAGDDVSAKKPAPDIYLLAMEQMGFAPHQCLAIEDSANGVQACLGSGIRSLVVSVNDYTRNQDFSHVPLVVDHLGEPEHPCRILRGQMDDDNYVKLQTLYNLHHQSLARGRAP